MTLPAWLRSPDPDFRGFSREEASDLLVLREHHRPWRSVDRNFAGVPLMQDDGSERVVVLTIDLVEPHAHRYWSRHSSANYVLTNELVQG